MKSEKLTLLYRLFDEIPLLNPKIKVQRRFMTAFR